jgi:hypothetical protein
MSTGLRVDLSAMMRAALRFPTAVLVLGVGASLCTVDCASDTTGPALSDPAHLYWALTLNHHAITLALTAPYNQLQLVATPSTANGTPLVDSGTTIWTVSDTSVHVSATGLLTAIASAPGVTIMARRTIGEITNTDSAVVNVNDTTVIPHLATLALDPVPTVFGLPVYDLIGLIGFAATALDAQGDTIPNVAIRVTSVTPNIFQADNDLVAGGFIRESVGHALLVAEATVYGVPKVDTLPFTVGWWHQVVIDVLPQYPTTGSRTALGVFAPAEDTVAAGGTVVWKNELPGLAVDVVFDDSSAVQAVDSATFLNGFCGLVQLCYIPTQGGGNIRAFAPVDTGSLQGQDTLGVRARSFPTPGTYRYHSALYGTSGIIHVLPEFQVP